jgi:hypothetical protein
MQVCASLGEKVVNSRPQLSPNEISDHLITRIRSSMKDRYTLYYTATGIGWTF